MCSERLPAVTTRSRTEVRFGGERWLSSGIPVDVTGVGELYLPLTLAWHLPHSLGLLLSGGGVRKVEQRPYCVPKGEMKCFLSIYTGDTFEVISTHVWRLKCVGVRLGGVVSRGVDDRLVCWFSFFSFVQLEVSGFS